MLEAVLDDSQWRAETAPPLAGQGYLLPSDTPRAARRSGRPVSISSTTLSSRSDRPWFRDRALRRALAPIRWLRRAR